jgi:hypothetical protein
VHHLGDDAGTYDTYFESTRHEGFSPVFGIAEVKERGGLVGSGQRGFD